MTAVERLAIRRAQDELVALAVAVREDWSAADVLGALCAAAPAGVTWEQALVGLTRLMVDPGAHPRELIPDWRSPVVPVKPAAPEVVKDVIGDLHDTDWYRRAHPEGDRDDAA